MTVAGIILAAGASRRLGQAKQLVTLGCENLLERMVRVANDAKLDPVIVVLGADAAEIREQCALGATVILVNDSWSEGVSTSIRLAVMYAATRAANGAVLMTCDQPAVTSEHLGKLLAGTGEHACSSAYAGRCGTPAYFPAGMFPALCSLKGDVGAKSLLEGAPAILLPGGEFDVDTPADLKELEGYSQGLCS